jgi:hypothetical protein
MLTTDRGATLDVVVLILLCETSFDYTSYYEKQATD